MKRNIPFKLVLGVLACLIIAGWAVHLDLLRRYEHSLSAVVIDRNGEVIQIEKNDQEYFVIEASRLDPKIEDLLLKKEDRFFYFHPGVNPVSTVRALLYYAGIGERTGGSTLTQQLAKLLYQTESDRTVANKLKEALAAVSIEMFESKNDISLKYANSVFLGNQIQGFETASRAYFGLPSNKLSAEQILQILVTLNNPSYMNPLLETNIPRTKIIAHTLEIEVHDEFFTYPAEVARNLVSFNTQNESFELQSWLKDVKDKRIQVTVDENLTKEIRTAITSLMPGLYARDASAAAAVVINAHTGEILSIVGTPDPSSQVYGQQINMALQPRQIASTVKPLLYAKAFEAGLRPYTFIDDKEYAYTTKDGRILYPRNFDEKYRGLVRADYALSNSINVPAIKTLEFLTPEVFQEFTSKLGYNHPEKIIEHQLGTALGTIDMNLLELTHYYSIFPNTGVLLPLRLFSDARTNKEFFPQKRSRMIDPKYTELITKTLSDRYLAIDQFGYASALNLPLSSYALKTGTSDDYRDTWVIGYTPDFIVGAWVGNTDNSPTKNLSGQTGAGEVWSRVMQIVAASQYNQHSEFTFPSLVKVPVENRDSFGLKGDNVPVAERLLLDRK
jgi:penicillin-binding protein 1C